MRLTLNATIGGKGISGIILVEGNGEPSYEATLPAGKAGTLTTRTDNDTGVATLSTGHGIISTDVVDVFWDGGIRRGMVATVAVNAVTIDGGAGDNLPALTTALVVCKQTVLDVDITGPTILACLASAQRRASIAIQKNDATVIANLYPGKSGNDGEPALVYAINQGMTNPFAAADVGKVVVSNGSEDGTCLVKIGFVVNA